MQDRSGPLEYISDTLCIRRGPCLLDVRDGDVHGKFAIDIPRPFDRNLGTPARKPQRPHDPLERGPPPTVRSRWSTPDRSTTGVRA